MVKIAALLALLLLSFSASGDNGEEKEEEWESFFEKDHAIGASIGVTSSRGLSYLYWPGKHGLRVNFSPIYDFEEDDLGERTKNIRIGGSYLREIIVESSFNFFIEGTMEYHNRFDEPEDGVGVIGERETIHEVNLAVGPGFNFRQDVFSYHVLVGYGLENMTNNYQTTFNLDVGAYYWF